MRVTIYDKNPGPGAMNWFLKMSWLLGSWFQKFVGAVDDYHGVTSWDEAKAWLESKNTTFSVIQYWGHGSPGIVWLAKRHHYYYDLLWLKPFLTPDSLLWFRICYSFKGKVGQDFSKQLADTLQCTIGGHTRIIGVWQGGLHTRTPNSEPKWSVEEGYEPKTFLRDDFKFWLKNTILCLRTSIPKGW